MNDIDPAKWDDLPDDELSITVTTGNEYRPTITIPATPGEFEVWSIISADDDMYWAIRGGDIWNDNVLLTREEAFKVWRILASLEASTQERFYDDKQEAEDISPWLHGTERAMNVYHTHNEWLEDVLKGHLAV